MNTPATKSATPVTTPPAPAAAPPRRRWPTYATIGVIGIGCVVWALTAMTGDRVPRLNEGAVALTKFMETRQFEQLPFDQQRQYYKVMDDRDAELDQAYAAKKLTEAEYRAGIEAAWLGKHVNRVEKYFSLAPGAPRTSYLGKLLDKKERKKAKSAKSGAKPNPDEIDVDETAAEMKVEKWPPAVRSQWDIFHEAYRVQRKAIEKAKEPAPAAQTKPAAQ